MTTYDAAVLILLLILVLHAVYSSSRFAALEKFIIFRIGGFDFNEVERRLSNTLTSGYAAVEKFCTGLNEETRSARDERRRQFHIGLLPRLRDESADTRNDALIGLADASDHFLLQSIKTLADKDPEETLRKTAWQVLLMSPSDETRYEAERALVNRDNKEPWMLALLYSTPGVGLLSSNWQAREFSAKVIAESRDTKIMKDLCSFLRASERRLRMTVAEALSSYSDLTEPHVSEAMCDWGSATLGSGVAIKEGFRDEDWNKNQERWEVIREKELALAIFSKNKDSSAVRILRLALNDPYEEIKLQAVLELQDIGGPGRSDTEET